jgi:hypothetical protein
MRCVVFATLSIVTASTIAPIAIAQNDYGVIRPAPAPKTPADRVSQSHQALAKAKGRATTTNADADNDQANDTTHFITVEQEKAIPYRACINARGWKNGRLICADDGNTVAPQNGREVEGPFSSQ